MKKKRGGVDEGGERGRNWEKREETVVRMYKQKQKMTTTTTTKSGSNGSVKA